MMALFDSLVHITADGRWFDDVTDASEDRLLREMDEDEPLPLTKTQA